jgi:hypothetical protein
MKEPAASSISILLGTDGIITLHIHTITITPKRRSCRYRGLCPTGIKREKIREPVPHHYYEEDKTSGTLLE